MDDSVTGTGGNAEVEQARAARQTVAAKAGYEAWLKGLENEVEDAGRGGGYTEPSDSLPPATEYWAELLELAASSVAAYLVGRAMRPGASNGQVELADKLIEWWSRNEEPGVRVAKTSTSGLAQRIVLAIGVLTIAIGAASDATSDNASGEREITVESARVLITGPILGELGLQGRLSESQGPGLATEGRRAKKMWPYLQSFVLESRELGEEVVREVVQTILVDDAHLTLLAVAQSWGTMKEDAPRSIAGWNAGQPAADHHALIDLVTLPPKVSAPEAAPEMVDGRSAKKVVAFATNRTRSNSAKSAFSSTPQTNSNVLTGTATVDVDVSNSRRRFPFFALLTSASTTSRGQARLTPQCVQVLGGLVKLGQALAATASDDGHVLVFIHGYRTSFERAVESAAQFAADIDWSGPVVAFSWPSEGNVQAYVKDRNKADASVKALRSTIDHLHSLPAVSEISIVAHSMGNRVLAKFIEGLGPGPTRISSIVMAAPDVDWSNFDLLKPSFNRFRLGMSVYASPRDVALKVSRKLGGTPVGLSNPLYLSAPLGSTEVKGQPIAALNHTYLMSSRDVQLDVGAVLRGGVLSPDRIAGTHTVHPVPYAFEMDA
jgi:esterase/lipase superfamily enzyme